MDLLSALGVPVAVVGDANAVSVAEHTFYLMLTLAKQGLAFHRAELAAMKPSAVVINTARGGLIDETALVEALSAGGIAVAGRPLAGSSQGGAHAVLGGAHPGVRGAHGGGLGAQCAGRAGWSTRSRSGSQSPGASPPMVR
jgi:hypothetical protein